MHLIAHPDALELSDLEVREGRTRTAVADEGIVGFATWLSTGTVTEIEDLLSILGGWGRGSAVRWCWT